MVISPVLVVSCLGKCDDFTREREARLGVETGTAIAEVQGSGGYL
jgi:hypothetical protein